VQSPVNDEGSDEDENSQDGQNAADHIADVEPFPWDRRRQQYTCLLQGRPIGVIASKTLAYADRGWSSPVLTGRR